MSFSMKLLGHLKIKICVWTSVYVFPKAGLPREVRLSQVWLMEQKLERSKIESLCSKEVGKVVTIVKEVIIEAEVRNGMGWGPLGSQL